MIKDIGSERAVLAGIAQYGSDAYFDVTDFVSANSFTVPTNSVLYQCFKDILENDNQARIDIPSVQATSRRLGLDHLLKKRDDIAYIQSLLVYPVSIGNVRKFAATIRKLEVGRLLDAQLDAAKMTLAQIKGTESINQILGIAENAVFDFSSLLNDRNDADPKLMGDGLLEYMKYLSDNPIENIGIPSGYPTYDLAIGGGFRNGTVNMIGARPKTGKSFLALNIGTHIAKNVGMPVLYLDTEMMQTDQTHRMMGLLSGISIKQIETGKFGEIHSDKQRVFKAAEDFENAKVPFHYRNISGLAFEEQLSIMRRWIVKTVGLNTDGTAKPCIIIYDYLKLMGSEGLTNNLAEYQLLGFMMTSLHNFAVRYNIPILSFLQLNRDGINKESTDAASGSDRIIWLCSNFSIYKRKSEDEIAEDGAENGNRKMVPVVSRHGTEWNDGDYISMRMTGHIGKIVEGKTRAEMSQSSETEGFISNGNAEDDIPFEG